MKYKLSSSIKSTWIEYAKKWILDRIWYSISIVKWVYEYDYRVYPWIKNGLKLRRSTQGKNIHDLYSRRLDIRY